MEHRFKTEKNHEDKFEINVELNGVDIFAKNEIAKSTERAEKFVNLKPENKLKFDIEHAHRNKYILEVKEVGFVKDIQAPVISMAIQSEAITNNSQLPVTISDISGEITTYVWKVMPQAQLAPVTAGTVNQLIITTTQSSFNIPLTEGINYFIIQSVDRFNNKSEFVYLNNILLDTIAPLPVLISPAALASDYTYQFPYGKNIYVRFSEKVQSVSINGIVATVDSIGQSASVLVPIANAGENSFQIVASDLAGNTTQFIHKFNVVHVTAPPVLNITYPISFITKENKINLPFSVQSQVPTKTIIFLNGVEVFSTLASGSSPDLNLPVEGGNHIELRVYYAVDGFDTSLKTSGAFTIERDTIAPLIASSSPENGSIIYTNHLPLAIPLNILFSEYLTYISINNVFNQPTFYNSYATNYYASFAGVQQMQIQAVDRAGNIANLIHSVNVDFSDVAPVLDFNANVKNLLTNKISVSVSGTSDKFLSSASLNGAAMQISSDGKSFFGVFDAPKNGRYKLEVTGTDRYGNIGSTSTYIRVLTSLPDQVLPATPPKLSYDFTTRTYVPQFGPAFQPQPSDDLCAALDNVFSQEAEFKDNLANLENNLQDVNDATGMTLKVPFEQDLKNFMGDVDEALNYIKAPYLMMCKGINILPKTDCPTNRSIFKLVMGSYPEPMIIKALPIPVSVQNFLIPRTNICTGFDSSGLNCQDMIAILPLIADLVLPGTGQLMASPAGQAISEALLCKELCDVPAVAETPVCKEYKLPDIPQISPMPTGIALPQRFGGGGSFGGGGDWGGGGGWPGGGGSCGGWFEPSCPGGGGGGSGDFYCSAYSSLFFCGNNGEYSRDHITIDTGIDCASLESGTLSSIIDLSVLRGLPLTVAYSSYIAQCLKSPVPGYPKTSKPVLTVTAPVQNQEVTDTVQVAGYVDDVYAQVQVNGQLVATVPSIFGASFNVMIPVPVDAVIRVEAADMFGNRAAPVEVVLSTSNKVPRFAYVANAYASSISTYTIDVNSGALTPIGKVATGESPYQVTAHPSGKFVYVVNSISNSVSSYVVDAYTGALTRIGDVAAGSRPGSIAVDPSGRFAYVSNYLGNTVSSYIINSSTGALIRLGDVATGFEPKSIVVDPSSKFVYVAHANGVSSYMIDTGTGALARIGDVKAGETPFSVAVDPNGRFAYVASWGSVTISAFTINASTGVLTPIGDVAAGNSPFFVTIDPSGKFVYTANPNSNSVSAYSINASTGALTHVGDVTAGTKPYSVTVDPSGKFAYAANVGSDNVSVYRVDANTGVLTYIGEVPAGRYAISVVTTSGP